MALGKHYGAFAKGFMDSLLAAYKLSMTKDLYDARMNFYNARAYALMHPQGKGINSPELQGVMSGARTDPNYGYGGGGSKDLSANQDEAYKAARSEGLSDNASRALVANMSGESLADSSNVHQDGSHMAHGIVQWDDQRSAAIQKQFGRMPQDMSVADQTKAAIWEMKTNPTYRSSWGALNSNASPQDMVKTLVTNYERPGDPDKSINQRLQHLGNLPTNLGGGAGGTAVAATTPTKGPNKGKASPAKTAAADGSYQVAGDTDIALSPEAAAKARADLEAHRAAPTPAMPASVLPAPGAEQSNDVAGLPRYGTGPADTGDPSGRMIPPAGGQPSMGYPALQPGPANVAPSPPPGPIATDTGARPDLTARSPATAIPPTATANVPPVTPRVSPPPNAPGYAQIDRPNADPNQRGREGAPKMSAIDLSHLWGLNPPVADRAPAPPGPPPPASVRPQDSGDWSSAVGAPDMSAVDFTGAAKGGPIQRFAAGGAIPSKPTTAFYGGGASYTPPAAGNVQSSDGVPYSTWVSPTSTTYVPSSQQPSMGATAISRRVPVPDQASAGYKSWGPFGGAFWGSQAGVPNANPMSGEQVAQNLATLTPDQRSWYANQVANNQAAGGGSQWLYNPASYPGSTPAATPAATPNFPLAQDPPHVTQPSVQNITNWPAALNDPTTTTVTGAQKLPNSITAKSYDPNVDAQTGAGFANTSNVGGTNYSVGSNDLLKQNASGQISGNDTILSRKGGAIPSRATRFAAGGAAPGAPGQSPGIAYMMSPNYIGPRGDGGWSGSTPYSALAPNQQTWADTTRNLINQAQTAGRADYGYWSGGGQNPTGVQDTSQYWNQLTAMPDAIWPTAAPAAPTPLNEPAPSAQNITNYPAGTTDPTTTTVTGAPGLPNSIQAKSYDPNVDAQTGAGFANTSNTGGTDYSVGSNDLLKQNTSGQISGSRKGGPITRRVSRYDDGGGVSPSIAGMPPGLGGGQQQQVPPIYFNPATYSGAGAPVGKGVSQNSVGTFKAGAIPSLPMARGGVVGYDDGGGVGMADPDLQQASYDDMEDARDDQASAGAAPPPAPTTTYNSAGEPTNDVNPNEFLQPASGTGGGGTDNTPPPDPTIAQIKDDQGNPSKGLIGAISDGLHWLGSHLGIGGAQAAAIAPDAQTQTNRQHHVTNDPNGATYMTHQNVAELQDLADPGHQLQGAYRNIAALEAGWKWAMSRGDDATAGRLAAAMLHYSVLASQNLSVQARHALYSGDIQDAVDKANQASDALVNGRLQHMTLNKDGTVTIQDKNLNGEVEWQHRGAAATILEHATALGSSGKLQWDSLESQAAKYDHTYGEAVKNRQANAIAQGQEDQITAANQKFAPVAPTPAVSAPTPGLPGPGNRPATITAQGDTTQTAPITPGAPTAASQAAPQTADSNVPGQDVQPVSDQVSFNRILASLDQQDTTERKQVVDRAEAEAQQHYEQYPDQSLIKTPADQKAYNDAVIRVKAANAAVDKTKAENIIAGQKQVSDVIQAKREAAKEEFSQASQTVRMREQEKLQAQHGVDQSARDAALNVQKAGLDEHNAGYADQMKREYPRSDVDVHDLLADVGGSSFVPLARSLLPEQSEIADDKAARTALAGAGYDAGTQRTMKQAFDNGLRYSSLSSRDEVAAGVAQLAQGKDGKGTYDKRTDTYHISVANDDGSISRLTLPASDAISLQKAGYKIATAQAIKTARGQPTEARPSGPGTGMPAIPSLQDWQTRSPAEQTYQPPM